MVQREYGTPGFPSLQEANTLMRWVEYLRGQGNDNNNECAALFKDYKSCLTVWLLYISAWSSSGGRAHIL